MAISVDYTFSPRYRVIIPQADLTLVDAGPPALYSLDTDQFWKDLKIWEASHIGMPFSDIQRHNPEYVIQGDTYAQSIEVLNSDVLPGVEDEYEVFFSPDTQYSVRLEGSNNNISDLQNNVLANNTTQVIPGNSGGLIRQPGLDADAVWERLIGGTGYTASQCLQVLLAVASGELAIARIADTDTAIVTIRNVEDDTDVVVTTVNRLTGERLSVTLTPPSVS